MLAKRLLALGLAASFLLGCGLDVPNAPASPTPGAPDAPDVAPASHAEPDATRSPEARLQAVPSTPRPTLTPGPTRTPVPHRTPQGSTGLRPSSRDGVFLDTSCLDAVEGFEATPEARVASPFVSAADLPSPFRPIDLEIDDDLQRSLIEALGGDAGRYAFVVKDLATGRGAAHNSEKVYNAASLFKLFIMFEVFHQQSLGLLNWQDELVITPYYDAFALSPRITELCQVLTVAEALSAMLAISDNAAAVLLQDLVGAGNVNNAIAALGLTESGLFTDGLPVTALDLAHLLEAIARGKAVSDAASADMLQLMASEGIDNGLIAALPGQATVAHKTGNWSDATHQAGIVFTDFGAYLFVVLSETSHETRGIQALSATAYTYFANLAH